MLHLRRPVDATPVLRSTPRADEVEVAHAERSRITKMPAVPHPSRGDEARVLSTSPRREREEREAREQGERAQEEPGQPSEDDQGAGQGSAGGAV
jgi:hypothetical protein